jgi:uncharacterized protein
MFKRIVITAAVVAGAMSALPSSAQTAPQLAGTRLDLTVRGEVSRTPDIALISAGVVTQAVDARAALSANALRMTRVLAALKKAGVQARDITTSNIALSAQYRYADNQSPVITGYQATNSVSIRFRDIAQSGAILDTLVAEGANQINGPTLSIEKPEAAMDEARIAAMKTARIRADLYAKAAGLTIKRIVSVTESNDGPSPQPYPMMAMARSESAAAKTEIAAGEQAVGVTLSVTYELN